jgi:hypothetical protein
METVGCDMYRCGLQIRSLNTLFTDWQPLAGCFAATLHLGEGKGWECGWDNASAMCHLQDVCYTGRQILT